MNSPKRILPAIVAVTIGLAFAIPTVTSAAAREGKGAFLLMPTPKSQPAPVQTISAEAAHRSCAQCRDVPVVVVDRFLKGSRPEERKTVLVHQCPSFETKITTVGHGKAKPDKGIHTCRADAQIAKSCCGVEENKKQTGTGEACHLN